jgi:hypothetical protein
VVFHEGFEPGRRAPTVARPPNLLVPRRLSRGLGDRVRGRATNGGGSAAGRAGHIRFVPPARPLDAPDEVRLLGAARAGDHRDSRGNDARDDSAFSEKAAEVGDSSAALGGARVVASSARSGARTAQFRGTGKFNQPGGSRRAAAAQGAVRRAIAGNLRPNGVSDTCGGAQPRVNRRASRGEDKVPKRDWPRALWTRYAIRPVRHALIVLGLLNRATAHRLKC